MRPDWPLETDRLVLRLFAEGDLDALYAMYSDAEVVRYLYNDPRTRDEVRTVLERKIAGAQLEAEGDWLGAAGVARDTGRVVGGIGLQGGREEDEDGRDGCVVVQ